MEKMQKKEKYSFKKSVMFIKISASVGSTEASADTSEQPNKIKAFLEGMSKICTSVNYSPHFSGLFHTNHYSEYQVVEVSGKKKNTDFSAIKLSLYFSSSSELLMVKWCCG